MGRTTFFQKRHISEMEAVDADGYEQLKQRADLENMTVKEFSKLCKEQLNKSSYKQKLKALKCEAGGQAFAVIQHILMYFNQF